MPFFVLPVTIVNAILKYSKECSYSPSFNSSFDGIEARTVRDFCFMFPRDYLFWYFFSDLCFCLVFVPLEIIHFHAILMTHWWHLPNEASLNSFHFDVPVELRN